MPEREGPTSIPEERGTSVTRGESASSSSPDCLLRKLAPDDGGLLATATVGNVNWCGERITISDLADRPELRHYAAYAPSRGDFGLVAESHGQPVGVVWVLFLPSDDPGYGFVDDRTPELSIWVKPGHRGRGLGHALLAGVLLEARLRGVDAISLSVESGNPATELYRAVGFTEVVGREADGVMIRRD